MTSVLTTCALFLVLPWKLTGQTTDNPKRPRLYAGSYKPTIFSPSNNKHSSEPNEETSHSPYSTRLHEGLSTGHEATTRGNEPTIFSSTNIKPSIKLNGKTSHSPGSTGLHKGLSTGHERTKRADEPTIFYSTSTKLSLKTNNETTNNPSSTSLHEGTSKDHEKTTHGGDEYTTEAHGNVSSSELPPQTMSHRDNTSLSHTKNLTQVMTTSGGERRSSSNLSPSPFLTELTQKRTFTPQPQNTEKVAITRNDQTLYNLKSTNKGLDRHTEGNRTTRSVENESTYPETESSTHVQKPPEVFTTQSGVNTRTKKWSTSSKEKKSTQPPKESITASNGTLKIRTNGTLSNQERNDTVTYPLNTLVTTDLGPTVKTEDSTRGTTDIMDKTATDKITSSNIIHKMTTLTTQRNTIKSETPKSPTGDGKQKQHPGKIVASLIGTILFLMFISFLVIWTRNRRLKKKKMDNTDWAGPSPFIDGDINPNLPNVNEDGPFNPRESKRISLNSFLPQRLSKRFSMLSPTEEEIPLENVSSTFGQRNVLPLNGNEQTTPDQTQTHNANSSLPEVSEDPTIPEPVSIPPAPENKENTQPEPKPDDETIPAPPAETDIVTPTPFEEVDLNGSLDKNTESTSPSDHIDIPSPPPQAQP